MSETETKLRRALEEWRQIAETHGTTCRQGMGFCANEWCEDYGCMAARARVTLAALDGS